MPETVVSWWRVARSPQGRWIWYVAAAGVYLLVMMLPIAGLSAAGSRALAVAGVAAFLWVTNTAPPAITGIVVLFLLPFTGALSSEQTYAYFGNHAVFLVLGAFILASPVMRSGLSSRIALWAVATFGRSPTATVVSIMWIAALMSFVISEHAVVAMLFPIVLEIVRAAKAKPGSRFGLAAFLALAWGAVIGGTATVLGGARAPLAMGILESSTGQTINFVEWTLWSLPGVVIMLALAQLVLMHLMRKESLSLDSAHDYLSQRTEQLGAISQREILTAGIMLFTIGLWIALGESWGLDVIALLGVILVFVTQVARWPEVEEDVNWGVFVMYGSAIALSAALRETGAAESLAHQLLDTPLNSPALVFAIIVLMAMGLTEIMSNAASVAVLMPVALVLAAPFGIDPQAVTLGVAVPAGLAFMIPVSTPAIAIIISVPYARALHVLRYGVLLKLAGLIVFLLMAHLYWPLFGLAPF